MQTPILSLILPVYNEEETIDELHRRLTSFLSVVGESWEVVFVNDGSVDRSAEMLNELAAKDARFKVIHFARNFGHQIAITAGMDHAEGDAVVIMDADLQDPPEVVHEMLERWREGYDVVYGRRSSRAGESFFKKVTAAAFYRFFRRMIPIDVPLDTGDFRLLSRRVILTMRALREQHRFVRGMVSWVGFKQCAVEYDRPERFAGETKYPMRKMLGLAVDAITSFSVLPLRFATWMGVFSAMVAIFTSIWTVYAKFFGDTEQGWSTIVIVVSLAASAQLLMIGILGEYVGRIYEEVKRRPLYVVQDTLNVPNSDADMAAAKPRPNVGTPTASSEADPPQDETSG